MTTPTTAAAAPPGTAGADDPPPLDLPDGGLLGSIVRLNVEVGEVLERVAAASGLTFADYLVLGVVRRSSHQQSAPTAIATVLGRTTGGMTLTLDRLESAGLVRRAGHATDRRRVVVELTPAGMRLATRVNAALHEWEASLDLPIPTDQVVGVLDAVTAGVQAHTG